MKRTSVFFFFALMAGLASCVSVRPRGAFDPAHTPPVPDYASLDNWAAHPDKKDPADLSPTPEYPDLQKEAEVDVIFLHPTTYTGSKRSEHDWNASVFDAATNQKTDKGTIQYQASIFNGSGKVYAPRYRQAHLSVFFSKKDTVSAKKALDLAYSDVQAAFDYYLKHWNHGRPFILVGHSQGARHAMQLLQERIEGTPLEHQLVAAYIVGWPVNAAYYKTLQPCEKPDQNDCYCSWRTWERNFGMQLQKDQKTVCTNPLTWSTKEKIYASKSLNRGGVVRPFNKIYPNITDAEVYKGILLATKPKFKGSVFFRRKNYHIGDLNLYYLNVRENAQLRAQTFLRR